MRRLLLLLLTVVPLALGLSLAGPPASAGGPTSVLVTEPGSTRAAGLYYDDPAYEELDRLLAGGEELSGQPAGLGHDAINLTWLIHDVQPWRTQQVWLDAEGGPVVATSGTEATGDPGAVTWTRPVEGKALRHLLEDVLSGSTPALAAPDAPAAAPAPAPDAAVTEPVVTETAWWSLTGWRWVVPGLLLGLVLGLVLGAGAALAVRARAQRGPDGREPRQVLVDLVP